MKLKTFKNIVCIILLFCAIWSREPVKMILSSILLHYVFKLGIGEDKTIGKQLIEKTIPIDFTYLVRRK